MSKEHHIILKTYSLDECQPIYRVAVQMSIPMKVISKSMKHPAKSYILNNITLNIENFASKIDDLTTTKCT